jgi:hypothetical protein
MLHLPIYCSEFLTFLCFYFSFASIFDESMMLGGKDPHLSQTILGGLHRYGQPMSLLFADKLTRADWQPSQATLA